MDFKLWVRVLIGIFWVGCMLLGIVYVAPDDLAGFIIAGTMFTAMFVFLFVFAKELD